MYNITMKTDNILGQFLEDTFLNVLHSIPILLSIVELIYLIVIIDKFNIIQKTLKQFNNYADFHTKASYCANSAN